MPLVPGAAAASEGHRQQESEPDGGGSRLQRCQLDAPLSRVIEHEAKVGPAALCPLPEDEVRLRYQAKRGRGELRGDFPLGSRESRVCCASNVIGTPSKAADRTLRSQHDTVRVASDLIRQAEDGCAPVLPGAGLIEDELRQAELNPPPTRHVDQRP